MNDNSKHNQTRIRRMVAAVLIVAAAVVFMGVFLVFQCLTFDEDGAHVVDRYGVLETAEQTEPEETTEETDTEPEETQPEEPENSETLRGAMLSAKSLTDSAVVQELLQLAEDGTLGTVIVNIKDSEGNLNLPVDTTELDDAEQLQESYAEELANAIGTLHNAGVYVVGRIYCLHDELAAEYNTELAMQYDGGGRWRDYDDTHWLDPTNPGTIGYLCDIAASAVDAGCDEIVLDDFTFPPRGHIDRIEFYDEPADQASVLLNALEEIRQSVGEAAVSLSADSVSELTQLSETATEDGFPVGDVQALLESASRIYVSIGDEAAADLITDVQQTAPNALVIPVFTSMEDWQAYDGDAVLSAVMLTRDAIAVLTGELSAETYDDEDESEDGDDSYDEDETESSDDETENTEDDTSEEE